MVLSSEELLKNAKEELEKGNYENAIQLIESIKPKLKVKLLNTSFTLNRWEKVEMEIINEGDAIAENIIFKFSDDITIRNLSEIEVKPKSKKRVEFYLKPNSLGEVPLEVGVRYEDHLNREYIFKGTIILRVEERINEIMLDIHNIIWDISMELQRPPFR